MTWISLLKLKCQKCNGRRIINMNIFRYSISMKYIKVD